VGKLTRQQLEDIAKTKMTDLNTVSLEAAMRTSLARPSRWASTSSHKFFVPPGGMPERPER
jgi:hypothetical protein